MTPTYSLHSFYKPTGNIFPPDVKKPPNLITGDRWIFFFAYLYSSGIVHHLHVAMLGEFTSDTVNYISLSTAILLWEQ